MALWDFLKKVGGGIVNGLKFVKKTASDAGGPIKDFIRQVAPKVGNLIDQSQPIRDLLGKGADYLLNNAGSVYGVNEKPKFNISGDDVSNALKGVSGTISAASDFL